MLKQCHVLLAFDWGFIFYTAGTLQVMMAENSTVSSLIISYVTRCAMLGRDSRMRTASLRCEARCYIAFLTMHDPRIAESPNRHWNRLIAFARNHGLSACALKRTCHWILLLTGCTATHGNERPRTTTNEHARPRTNTNDHEQPRSTTHGHARPRTTMHDHARPRTTKHSHAQPQTTTHSHARPRMTTHEHERPRTTTHDHERPRTTTNDHKRPRTTTDDHKRPLVSW